MPGQVNSWFATLLPRDCLFCGQMIRGTGGGRACCSACHADLPWIAHPCERCGRPLPVYRAPDLRRCADCGRLAVTSAVPLIRSALIYTYPVDRMIAAAKFRARLDYACELGELLADYLTGPCGPGELPEIIVPVPLHRRRHALRGHNQAAEIARPVADRLGLPLVLNRCRRLRHTPEQTSMTGTQRRRNLAGAFAADAELRGRRVAIVDDVLTTGTTVRAVSVALSGAGAAGLQIWTVARTLN